jgi:hypothetical protein
MLVELYQRMLEDKIETDLRAPLPHLERGTFNLASDYITLHDLLAEYPRWEERLQSRIKQRSIRYRLKGAVIDFRYRLARRIAGNEWPGESD